jgi:cytoskeleton-associated protein 5
VQTGDKIWAYIGRISAKDRTQLEERLRRVPSTSTAGKELTNPLVAKVAAATPRPASPSRQLNGLRPASPAVNSVGTMEQPPLAIQGRAASPSQVLSKNSALPTMAGPSGLRKSHLPSRLARGPAAAGNPKPAVDASASDQGRRALKPLNLGTLVPPAVALPTAPDKPDSGRSQSPTGEDISLVISSILSNDANRSVEALKKIQKGLEASNSNSEMPETFQGLAEHSEGLIGTITVQVSHVFDRVEDLAEPSNFRLAKHLMQTLHSFFSHAVLAESLTVDTITSLLEELTLRLLQTDESPDANVKEISRFINLILLKVFASGKRIAVFR